jgi:hypothetical protein
MGGITPEQNVRYGFYIFESKEESGRLNESTTTGGISLGSRRRSRSIILIECARVRPVADKSQARIMRLDVTKISSEVVAPLRCRPPRKPALPVKDEMPITLKAIWPQPPKVVWNL